jgi:hypothetical protein
MVAMLTDNDLKFLRDTINGMLPDVCNILSEALASDGQGGQTATWGTTLTNVGCRLDEDNRTGANQLTPIAGGLREAHRYILSLPFNTAISAHDRVEHGGNTYHVISVNNNVSWQGVTRAVLELV